MRTANLPFLPRSFRLCYVVGPAHMIGVRPRHIGAVAGATLAEQSAPRQGSVLKAVEVMNDGSLVQVRQPEEIE